MENISTKGIKKQALNDLKKKWKVLILGVVIAISVVLLAAIFTGFLSVILESSVGFLEDLGLSLLDIFTFMSFARGMLVIVNIFIMSIILASFKLGISNIYISILNNGVSKSTDILKGFKNPFKALLAFISVSFLSMVGTILFIIPGIIIAISYSYTFYILSENPNIGAFEAMKLSRQMTKGYKIHIVLLNLSLIGWGILVGILSIFTLGLPYLFFAIYVGLVNVGFYKKISSKGIDINDMNFNSNTYEKNILVEIKGEVNKPNLYNISEGTKLYQLIELAEGLTPKANINELNRARTLMDGECIVIKSY